NTLSYSGGSGPLALQLDLELDGSNAASDGADSWAVAGTYSAGSLGISLGHRDVSADDSTSTGVGVRFNMEGMWLGAGYTSNDDGTADNTTGAALLAGGSSGNLSWWVSLESIEDDDDGTDTDAINLAVVNSLSKGTRVWAEIALNDDGSGNDTNELILGLRKDF
ncbi:MAG: putative porin, partial [Gammaproteobacteria bacterium]